MIYISEELLDKLLKIALENGIEKSDIMMIDHIISPFSQVSKHINSVISDPNAMVSMFYIIGYDEDEVAIIAVPRTNKRYLDNTFHVLGGKKKESSLQS